MEKMSDDRRRRRRCESQLNYNDDNVDKKKIRETQIFIV